MKMLSYLSLRNEIKNIIPGMNCLFTIVAMAMIRYQSVVKGDCSWNASTQSTIFSLRLVQVIWVCSFIIAILPVVDFGEFSIDIGMMR